MVCSTPIKPLEYDLWGNSVCGGSTGISPLVLTTLYITRCASLQCNNFCVLFSSAFKMSDLSDVVSALSALELKARGEVRISALHGGTFTLPTKLFVSEVPDDERSLVPSLSFLITQTLPGGQRKYTLFDLGLRRDTSSYTPQIQSHLHNRLPMQLLPDVRQSLQDGGLGIEAINEVILSHVHWDHIGTPLDYPHARFLVGAESLSLLESGLNGHMSHSNFQHNLFDNLNVRELADPQATEAGWHRTGGLNILALDENGSIYAVDSPGHLTGHIALLARNGDRRWVLLIGDACHDVRLLTGEKDIAEWTDTEGRSCCIHMDKQKATETLGTFAKWKRASEECGINLSIVFAHDAEWAQSHPEAFFPGLLK